MVSAGGPPSAFVIKAAIDDELAERFEFREQKTMYGGKSIAVDDTLFIIASENEGGRGLFARGRVISVESTPRIGGGVRQTPRVSVEVERTAQARRQLGRTELKRFSDWGDGRPESELNFKLYRQATNKIVGISSATAGFLERFF